MLLTEYQYLHYLPPQKKPQTLRNVVIEISEKLHYFPVQIILNEIVVKTYCALFLIFNKYQTPITVTFKTC